MRKKVRKRKEKGTNSINREKKEVSVTWGRKNARDIRNDKKNTRVIKTIENERDIEIWRQRKRERERKKV